MSGTETPMEDAIEFCRVTITDSSSSSTTITTTTTNPLVSRLHEILNTCSQSLKEDIKQDPKLTVAPVVEFLNYIHEASLSDQTEVSEQSASAVDVLNEIFLYISSPSLDQVVLEALSFELPESVSKFACVSDKCREIIESIIDHLVLSSSSPRDMLAVFCEALDPLIGMFKQPAYFSPLLSGLSKVLLHIQRRHFEQIKVTVPIVVSVLKGVSLELDDEHKDSFVDLINRATSVATSIHEVCQNLEVSKKEQIRAVLGLFVLQTVALVSSRMVQRGFSCIPVISQLSHFLPSCNMTYLGLITGHVVETLTNVILEDDNDDNMSCFSLVKHGSSLAVVWGHISDDVVKAAEEDLTVVKDNLQISQSKRWKTVGMLTYILSSFDQPWLLKKHAIDFLLYIMDGNLSHKCDTEDADCSSHILSLFSALQAIQNVIIYAPDAVLKKNAFAALKKVLADIPTHQRFEILKASITNNEHSSMIAILLGLVKDNIFLENRQKGLQSIDKTKLEHNKDPPSSPFWSKDVLELVEFVLKPPKGGPPSLPEQSDAVLSALNLYRFLLLTESTGKTNYTGVLSDVTLRKAYSEWLLPLRILVTGIVAENEKDCDEFSDDIICGLNPIQFVLHRCIELVEEKLQHCA